MVEAAAGAGRHRPRRRRHIDLLLTDVVMPKMGGRELADAPSFEHPGLPVLFMSGYARACAGPDGTLGDGVALVQKPYNEVTLLHGVHRAITAGVVGVPG